MVKTTFSSLFNQYDYTDFYNDNYEMDKDILLDKYNVVFVNKTDKKVIVVSDGLHFRLEGYTNLLQFLLDKNNSYVIKMAKITKFFIDLLEREIHFKETINKVEQKYPDMEKNIISFSLGGIYCILNKNLLKNFRKVVTINSPIIDETNDNYCSKYDIGTLLFSKLCYNSDNHNNSKMLMYDIYKLCNSILKVLESKNYLELLVNLHDTNNISSDETIHI